MEISTYFWRDEPYPLGEFWEPLNPHNFFQEHWWFEEFRDNYLRFLLGDVLFVAGRMMLKDTLENWKQGGDDG